MRTVPEGEGGRQVRCKTVEFDQKRNNVNRVTIA